MLSRRKIMDREGFNVGRKMKKIEGSPHPKGCGIPTLIFKPERKAHLRTKVRSIRQISQMKRNLPIIMLILALSMITLFLMQPTQTGFTTITHKFNYTDKVSLVVDDNYEYTWVMSNPGILKSIGLKGSVSETGSAKVYLEHDGESYLIFDSSRLSEGIGKVSGLVISNVTDNYDPISSLDKQIVIDVKGISSNDVGDVLEFDVSSSFNFDVDYSKLCTKFEVNSEIVECYGSSDCCALIGMDSSGNWNSSFYLSYERYGSSLENVVSAQVIYADYSLLIENPYSDIVYSDVSSLEALFYEARIEFEDVCVDSCLLPGFNSTLYKLVFVVSNASLRIDDVEYSIEEEIVVSDNIPLFVENMSNITVYKNSEFVVNLSSYFTDDDGDELVYSVYEVDNVSIIIDKNIAKIVPAYNFTGKRYTYFTTSDGYYNMTSNAFRI